MITTATERKPQRKCLTPDLLNYSFTFLHNVGKSKPIYKHYQV